MRARHELSPTVIPRCLILGARHRCACRFHRHGATNKIELFFDDRFTRFSNLASEAG